MPSNTTDPNSPESHDAALLDAARVIALAINTSDPEPLINKLGARVALCSSKSTTSGPVLKNRILNGNAKMTERHKSKSPDVRLLNHGIPFGFLI